MIHATVETQHSFDLDFDHHGDSYVEVTTPERLKDIMEKIDMVGGECCTVTSVFNVVHFFVEL